MTNHNPLAVDIALVAQLTALEQEELFFLQKSFMPLQGLAAQAIEDRLNGANTKGGVKCNDEHTEMTI